ncbi:MAG: hypothetical protein IH585_06740 [Anaerolineaceae bacterium]|nr:hypothetical protein [Anaerolineaceae bacterium]
MIGSFPISVFIIGLNSRQYHVMLTTPTRHLPKSMEISGQEGQIYDTTNEGGDARGRSGERIENFPSALLSPF